MIRSKSIHQYVSYGSRFANMIVFLVRQEVNSMQVVIFVN